MGAGRRARFASCALVLALSSPIATAACGIAQTGDAAPGGSVVPEASVTPQADGGNPSLDGTAIDPRIDGGADARPADLGNCQAVQCASGDPHCSDETCDPSTWSTTTSNGEYSSSGGDCYTRSTATDGYAYFERFLAEHDSYFYELRFLLRIAKETNVTVGEIGPVGRPLHIELAGSKLRVCDGPSKCTPQVTVPIATGIVVRIWGQMGRKRDLGSLVLQIDCNEVASMGLVGPFLGTTGKVRTRIGCVTSSATCDLLLDDIIFRAQPN